MYTFTAVEKIVSYIFVHLGNASCAHRHSLARQAVAACNTARAGHLGLAILRLRSRDYF